MCVISKSRVAVFLGLLTYSNLSQAQGFLPGNTPTNYRPVGTLVFRQDNSIIKNDSNRAAIHAGYLLYISSLQGALLDTNPARLEQEAELLEIPPADIERLYVLLNEFNTRLSSSRRPLLQQECAPLLAGGSLSNAEMGAAVARIKSDEPREEILQDVLQNIRDTFSDDVVGRLQRRVSRISSSPQFTRLQNVEQMVHAQPGGALAYLNEQCAVLQE